MQVHWVGGEHGGGAAYSISPLTVYRAYKLLDQLLDGDGMGASAMVAPTTVETKHLCIFGLYGAM